MHTTFWLLELVVCYDGRHGVGYCSRSLRLLLFVFFEAEDGLRYLVRARGLGDVYKRQMPSGTGIGRVEQVVDRCLASAQVVPVDTHEARPHGPLGPVGDDRARTYTSRRLLEIESRFLGQITGERETTPLGRSLLHI